MHRSNVQKHLKSWKATFSRTVETWGDRSLSKQDKSSLVEALTIWIAVCFDIVCLQTSTDAAGSLFSNLKSGVMAEPWTFRELQNQLQDLDGVLVRYGQISKRDVRASVKIGWVRMLCYHLCSYALRDIHQVLQFGKRVTLTSDPALRETAELGYFANLDRVAALNAADSFTDEEAGVIREWAKTFRKPTMEDLAWGNGQVAQGLKSTSQWRKIANHYATPMSNYAHLHALDHEEDDRDTTSWYFQAVPAIGTNLYGGADCSPKGKLQFVPKSYKTYRSICMEDLSLVPYQQAVFRALDRWFRRSLGAHVNLWDQPRSRRAAFLGSAKPGMYATIDLSMASDSVSIGLAKKWLWNTPLRDCLFATRSSRALMPDGKSTYELPIFASMGSATCFPVECLIFAAICYCAIVDVDGEYPQGALEPSWFVYGDDIVIETAYAPAVIARLEKNGFIVNTDKSFYDTSCQFREACGGEYFAGEDVTPVRLSRNFRSLDGMAWPKTVRHSALTSWYGLANALTREGLYHARRYVLHTLTRTVPTEYLPWTNDVSAFLMRDGDSPRHGVTGFGLTQSSSVLYTAAPVVYPYWDKTRYRRYRFTLSSRSVRQDYYTSRGHLISALTTPDCGFAETEPSVACDVSDRTVVTVQYE